MTTKESYVSEANLNLNYSSRPRKIIYWLMHYAFNNCWAYFLLLDWCEKVNSYLIFFQTCNILVDVMAGVYTEETLQPLNKTQIIKLFFKTQEQTNNTITLWQKKLKNYIVASKNLSWKLK